MRITQIVNEHMLIAAEERPGEAACWIKGRGEGRRDRETNLLFPLLENAFDSIRRRFGIGAEDVSELTYRRFAEHLRTSVRRAVIGDERGPATDGTLALLIRQNLPECYECAREIRSELERSCGARMPEDELLDLMLHVNKVVMSTEAV
ncbi:PRD domain-containing protein [Saccharibacillus sp. CPCC 101409]|uniref:PRD domain-containing protein n=1 Tax=Saccharibacillus sp. CPCC 101409 TaxID=3058041 RepID=UPI0026734B45|nr:PRD domain-containing protein [Saccharibacillus sp. CPCC 101409]MDO3410325.1 PRD domain-containing protein [Saccharibacillus sp. CPCC 101409]